MASSKSCAVVCRLFIPLRSTRIGVTSLLLLAAAFSSAQELPNSPLPQRETELAKTLVLNSALTTVDRDDAAIESEGHARILLVVPAFGVTDHQDAPPYTVKQKFGLAARQAFDPFVWISTGIQAGMSQASNEFPAYGQGTVGYGKRYGAAMLDVMNGGLAGTTVCVLMKQDPRYFRLGHGSIEHRILYSLAQQVSAKSDKGTRMFNWANVLGTFASSGLSNAYYPRPNRGFGLTMNRATVSLLWGFTGQFTDEFGPDVSRRLFHRRTIAPAP